MLNIAIWLVVGAVVGGVAGALMHTDEDQGVFVNVLVGIVGAIVAGGLVAPHLGVQVGQARVFNFAALAVALVGAVASLAVTSFLRRRDETAASAA